MSGLRKLTLSVPAEIADRKVRKGRPACTMKFTFDPSPEGFLGLSRRQKEKVDLTITPGEGNSDMVPIPLKAVVKGCSIEFDQVMVPPERLAELEYLVTEKRSCIELRIEASQTDLFSEDGQPAQDAPQETESPATSKTKHKRARRRRTAREVVDPAA